MGWFGKKRSEYDRNHPYHGRYGKFWYDGDTPKECIVCGQMRLNGMSIWDRTLHPPLSPGKYIDRADLQLICWDCIIDKWREP